MGGCTSTSWIKNLHNCLYLAISLEIATQSGNKFCHKSPTYNTTPIVWVLRKITFCGNLTPENLHYINSKSIMITICKHFEQISSSYAGTLRGFFGPGRVKIENPLRPNWNFILTIFFIVHAKKKCLGRETKHFNAARISFKARAGFCTYS